MWCGGDLLSSVATVRPRSPSSVRQKSSYTYAASLTLHLKPLPPIAAGFTSSWPLRLIAATYPGLSSVRQRLRPQPVALCSPSNTSLWTRVSSAFSCRRSMGRRGSAQRADPARFSSFARVFCGVCASCVRETVPTCAKTQVGPGLCLCFCKCFLCGLNPRSGVGWRCHL